MLNEIEEEVEIPDQLYRQTPLGIALKQTLAELKENGALNLDARSFEELEERVFEKFDEAFLEQFDQIPLMVRNSNIIQKSEFDELKNAIKQ